MPDPEDATDAVDAAEALGSVQKASWPELVGADAEEAVLTIQQERPDLLVVKAFPEGCIVSMDWAIRRVRVFYDANTKRVSRAPQVG